MEIPKTMRAVVLTGHGGMDKLEIRDDVSVPTPKAEEVLIKVAACGLNNTDVNTRAGWYSKAVTGATSSEGHQTVGEDDPSWGAAPISFPRIQGADAVGTVVALGADADQSLLGKRVMVDCWLRDWDNPLNKETTGYFGSECNGGFAEYTTVDYRNARPVNCDLKDAELATFSCSSSTAEGMLTRVDLNAKDTIIITGASGGVGTALIQLAKRRGAKVIAMASENKHDQMKALGADVLLPRSVPNLPQTLQSAIGTAKVSVIADVVGGPDWPDLIDTLERGGRFTCSGAIGGPIVELDLRTLYLRDLTFHGSTVIPPSIMTELVSYIEKGEIKPQLAATYPLEEFHNAQTAFIEKQHIGNIVVTP